MASFLRQKNWALSLVLFLPVVLLFTAVASLRSGHVAAASYPTPTGSKNQSAFVVKLKGTTDPSKYVVTAKRQTSLNNAANSLKLAYTATGPVDSDPQFLSSLFTFGGDSTKCNNSSSDPTNIAGTYTWNFTVTLNGKAAGTAGANYCGKEGNGDYLLVNVTVSDAANPASLSGTFNYTAPDGTSQPFRSNTVATLKSGNNDPISLSVGNDGKFTASGLSPGTYTLSAQYAATNVSHGEKQGFLYTVSKSVTLKSGANTLTATADGTTPGSGGGSGTCDGGTQDSNGDCTNSSDNTLDCGAGIGNWFICPVIQGAMDAANKLDGFIMNTLDTDVGPIFDGTTTKGSASNGYYTAWNSFRVLATALIVIAGLIMVASQALGFEFLDAYTIRKVLPRLLVAIIGISLSWPLMRLVVSFFDTVGFDVRSLLYEPFKNFGGTLSISTGILTSAATLGAIMALGWTSLTFILTALIAVFIGFIILVVRQVAIIMLIILAPIAIACYILPNTQRVWKLWSENFLGLMLMFPIISALIAAGHIFAAVSLKNGGGDTGTVVSQAIAIVAYFVPYFLLPLAARLATGVIGNLAGVMNNRSKGVFDRLKKRRGAAAASRFQRAQSSSLYDNNNRMGRIGNKLATWATDPVSNAAYYGRDIPGLRKRGYSVAGHIEHAKTEQTGKLFEEVNKMGFNDKGLRALSGLHYGLSDDVQTRLKNANLYGRAPTSVGDLQKMGQIMSEYGTDSEKLGGNAISGSIGKLATLYQDPEMNKASIAGAGTLGLAAHGFATTEDLARAGNSLAGGGYNAKTNQWEKGHASEAAFAQSVVSQAQLLGSRSRPDGKPGYGVMYQDGEFIDGMSERGGRDLALLNSLSSHDVAGAKGGFMDNMARSYDDVLNKSQTAEWQTNATRFNSMSKDAQDALRNSNPDAYKTLRRASEAAGMFQATKDQLFQWAGPYSQASADIKSRSLEMINKYGFTRDFEGYRTRERSPETRGGAAPGAGGDEG